MRQAVPRKWVRLFFFSFLLILLSGIFLFIRFIHSPLIPQNQLFQYELVRGGTLQNVTRDLVKQGYLHHPYFFKWLAYCFGQATALKAGEYSFEGGTTPKQLLDKMAQGRVNQYAVTIVEGFRLNQILRLLAGHPKILSRSEDKIFSEQNKQNWVRGFEGLNASGNVEGLFYPETYHFPAHTTDVAILNHANAVSKEKLFRAYEERAPNLPYTTPYEALVVASMIEKETARKSEKPLIADIILKRWKTGMRLQFDSTVIYALGDSYSGKLAKEDFRVNNSYNTYRYKGLPPTPISAPGWDSLFAALHPQISPYWYFAAQVDGKLVFSKDLSEQNRVVEHLRNAKKVRVPLS